MGYKKGYSKYRESRLKAGAQTFVMESETKEEIPVIFREILYRHADRPEDCVIRFPKTIKIRGKEESANIDEFYEKYHVKSDKWYHGFIGKEGIVWSGGKEEAERLGVPVKKTYTHFLPHGILMDRPKYNNSIATFIRRQTLNNAPAEQNYPTLREEISRKGRIRELKYLDDLNKTLKGPNSMPIPSPLKTLLVHNSGFNGEGDIWIYEKDIREPNLDDILCSVEVLCVINGSKKPYPFPDHFDFRFKTPQRLYNWKDEMLSYNVIPVIAFGSDWHETDHRWSILNDKFLDIMLTTRRPSPKGKPLKGKKITTFVKSKRKRFIPIPPILPYSMSTEEFVNFLLKKVS